MQRKAFSSHRRFGRHKSIGVKKESTENTPKTQTHKRQTNNYRRPKRTERIDFSRFINKTDTFIEDEVYVPENGFSDFDISENLKKSILSRGYNLPTPIQDKAIPELLKGRDVVGLANTGTGKTAAFLIPLVNKVLLNRKEQAMIIVPTRELAFQIDDELKKITRSLNIHSVCCVGGAPIQKQINQLKFHYNFIIGTPGRIKDFIERKMIILKEFNSIVLDEADRMLDMGFVDDMRQIINGIPKERQTLFFSATINRDIDKLILEFLRDPVRISVKKQDTAKTIEQEVAYVDRMKGKIETLGEMLKKEEFKKVLIFGRTKHGVERLSKELNKKGFRAESIHGDKTYSKRLIALKLFKEGQKPILVATDIAARGLDIPDVTHVINFDMPATNDDYIHRIGRTGRGEKKGKAITLVEL
uniref:DEAD/DEAH box helicase n=1 Tax=candidate division CPR3 bacterium TaxID=2268181 RepID=A0A7C4R569_UNCC3